jgi:hypothetical protein
MQAFCWVNKRGWRSTAAKKPHAPRNITRKAKEINLVCFFTKRLHKL